MRFTMPPEWELHERTIIEWPVKDSLVWPENYQEVCDAYEEVITAISRFEPVTVILNPEDLNQQGSGIGPDERTDATMGENAVKRFGDNVKVLVIPHNDAWARDNGPTFVRDTNGNLTGISWKFNAWGEKYKPYDLDDAMAKSLLTKLDVPCHQVDMVLEGGSIHVDGEGTLLSTKECLLNPNRNSDRTQEEIEMVLKEKLNIRSFLWLNNGLFGDETDGHVDNIACFAKPGTVIMQTCDDPDDPNYDITAENMDILKHAVDAVGRKLEIVELPQPPARFYKGERLTLSYLNFYFVNGGIILPVFGADAKKTDEEAVKILGKQFPDYEIVTVDGMGLIKEGGNVHCITQQMPLR